MLRQTQQERPEGEQTHGADEGEGNQLSHGPVLPSGAWASREDGAFLCMEPGCAPSAEKAVEPLFLGEPCNIPGRVPTDVGAGDHEDLGAVHGAHHLPASRRDASLE